MTIKFVMDNNSTGNGLEGEVVMMYNNKSLPNMKWFFQKADELIVYNTT